MNQSIKKIGLLGGDLRQIRLASLLSEEGYETAVWGFRQIMDDEDVKKRLSKCVRCADWESAICASNIVLLPLPASLDGVRLNCPLAASDVDIRLTEILEKMSPGSAVLGGKLPSLIQRLASERGIAVFDYYENEALQIKNSIPTAEGAIAIAIQELPVTVQGCSALVVGYGRVGRALANKLKLLGARVYVAARSARDLARSTSDGCISVRLSDYCENPIPTDIVYNTVPALIFDKSLLDKIDKNTALVELASGNAGIDMKAAAGRRVVSAQGLPGKLSPFTAGEIIFDAVREILEENNENGRTTR